MNDTAKRYQCRHIFTDGHRCGSPCLRHEEFCYYNHTTRRPIENPGERRRQAHFDIPLPEDRSAIQCSIGEVLLRIARNEIDPKRAGLLLYGLQIASLNLPPLPKKSTRDTCPVEEIVIDPQLGTLAPRIEVGKAQVPEERLSVVARLLRQVDEEEAQRNASRLADADKAPDTPGPAFGTWGSTASSGQPGIAGATAFEHAAEPPQEILPTLQATQASCERSSGCLVEFIGKENGLCDLPHGFALLPPVLFQRNVSLFFAEIHLALQDSFGPLHELAVFQLPGHLRLFGLHPGQFQLRAYEEADGGDETDLAIGVMVRLPVLQVDHANHSAPAKDRHGQEGFKGVLGQIVKYLEPGVDGGVGGYSHGLAVFGNPARYPLTYGDSKAIYQIGVRVLRCPQNQLVILPDEDEAGIASDDVCDNVQDTLQDRGKRVGGSDAAADLMERLYIARILQYFGVATH